MGLKRVLRTGVAAASIAAVLAPAPSGAAPGVEIRVGQTETFSRIEFRGGRATARREGQTVVVSLQGADPDIARLKLDPPRWVKSAEKRRVGGLMQIVLMLTDDAEVKVGAADGATYVNVFEKPAPAEAPPPEVAEAAPLEPEPARANPVPAGGVVRMQTRIVNAQVMMSFDWANPAGAAVFRRGDAVWVVFDAAANLDVSKAPRGLRQYGAITSLRGEDYSAVRIEAAPDVPVSVTSEGANWTVTLGPGDQSQPTPIAISRDDTDGPAVLRAPVAGATRVVQVADPEVGDSISVVTALGPPKGVDGRRNFVHMAVLSSLQGMAVESRAEDVFVTRDHDIVRIGRPLGLALSPRWAQKEKAQAALGAPQPASMPGLISDTWAQTGEGGFLARYNALLGAATAEAVAQSGEDAPVAAHLALARFLIGQDLSFEAIGVLNDAARVNPGLLDNGEFRGLRGMARVMARRYKEAQADFSSPALLDDSSSALWRSYIAAELAQWTETRNEFAKGAEAFSQMQPEWKARFARGDAKAALAQGDLNGAESRIRLALADKTDVEEELANRLVQARIFEAQGLKERALKMYTAIAGAPMEAISSPALLRATQLRMESGKLTPAKAVEVFDGLRYRWRGDGTELETIRALGHLYLSQGRYRQALEALRGAGQRMPDRPEALDIQNDMNASFRQLFLDGTADGLEPIQALALFYDFKELTPLGADGDLMVRKLVRRLVDVDLLDQAAQLLKYQAENRLDGVPRAQVATDLAVIYLMDRKPEQAIQTINASRSTVLPAALNAERRLVEARAWAGVGRFDAALEILQKDTTREAQDLRAEITWKQKDWVAAGPTFEKSLGARYKNTAPLSSEEEGKLLRAGVAYSLAGDDVALSRLYAQYASFLDEAHNPEALKIALTGVSSGHLSVADFGRVAADNEAFAGWVDKMKGRFRTKPAPIGARPAGAPAKQAALSTSATRG